MVVATDLSTGDRVVLDKGYVYKAVRASVAIPGIIAPLELTVVSLPTAAL